MTDTAILGQLSALHEMMGQLVTTVPAPDATRQFHPDLGSLAWYLGRSVYLETYWLRQMLNNDDDLTRRVEHLFNPGTLSLAEQCAALPPVDHLLNWAAEIQDEHLLRLANPGMLSDQPMLERDRLAWFLLQEQARNYERMLMVLNQRQLHAASADYRVERPLQPTLPRADMVEVIQGHYRVGARDDPAAYDNELPPQAVELSSFRIARRPVSSAEYLSFMLQDGYHTRDWWSTEGWDWLQQSGLEHPEYWRRDPDGHWYGIGINGPSDLPPGEPVNGISQHESIAFVAWASRQGGELAGAVLQHEYQWEVAARTGVLIERGRVREWCANPFHPYPEFRPFPSLEVSERFFRGGRFSLRGANLHTQRPLRRTSFRDHLLPEQRFAFTGARLVFPPSG